VLSRRTFFGSLLAPLVARFLPAPAAPPSVAFHPDAFSLAFPQIPEQYRTGGMSVPVRFDVLYGWGRVRPEMACRISGGTGWADPCVVTSAQMNNRR